MDTVIERPRNIACIEKGECQAFCGMCDLQEGEERNITPQSLFGLCRIYGVCLESCGMCEWLNGSRDGKMDCTRQDHPEHHRVNVKWNPKIKEWV